MHDSFNTRHETDVLSDEMLQGRGVIGIRIARSAPPTESLFFKSLTEAEETIRKNLLDPSVDGFWVSCVMILVDDLHKLLEEINLQRPFAAFARYSGSIKTYDLL